MNTQFDKEEQYLEDEYEAGRLTLKEFNEEMRELRRSCQAAAEEAAEEAYRTEMDRW